MENMQGGYEEGSMRREVYKATLRNMSDVLFKGEIEAFERFYGRWAVDLEERCFKASAIEQERGRRKAEKSISLSQILPRTYHAVAALLRA